MEHTIKQLPLTRLLFNHFYVGVFITLFYIWIGPKFIQNGLPGISVLLIAELVILAPLVLIHLWWSRQQENVRLSFRELIPMQQKLSVRAFLLWTFGGFLACLLIYIPLYPMGLYLRETLFAWLPEWYFNPTYGTDDIQLVARVFLFGILIDGFIGPVAEEFFFRGYLLPRMAFLKKWAPIVNGALFGLYHFWQPHNLIALMGLGIVLSYVVWKTKNIYIGMAIHILLNVIGAIGGYMAVLEGTMIGR